MSALRSCDRFEREGAILFERGERLGAHYSTCPECRAALAQYQRIIAALSFADEPYERDAYAEERIVARVASKQGARWGKLVPISAFFAFLSLGRRAAAAPPRVALCALVAATALIGAPNAAGFRAINPSGLPPVAVVAAAQEELSMELRRIEEAPRKPRAEAPAIKRFGGSIHRSKSPPSKVVRRRCTRASKCQNVVLEMVVNGLAGYASGAKGRRGLAIR